MELTGSLGLALMVGGFVVAGIGTLIVMVFSRDASKRTTGLRVSRAGGATSIAGRGVYLLSRPDKTLPLPMKLALFLAFVLIAARLAIRAGLLKPPERP